jgi:transposase InsO family protein
MTERGLSQRHACQLVGLQRSSARYHSHLRQDESTTVALVRSYAEEQPMYGYRIWRQEGLQLPRRKASKRRYGDSTGRLQRATRPNEVWSYDFLESRTERGGKLRILTLLDEYTRDCLSIHVARSISSHQVIQILEWLFLVRGAPGYLRSDNGPEFIAFALQQWLREHHCHTLYIRPGSPWENPFIESFNGTFRAECLNRWLFADGQEAQQIIEQWRQEYNHHRAHSSLGYMAPAVFAQQEDSHSTWSSSWGQPRVSDPDCQATIEALHVE